MKMFATHHSEQNFALFDPWSVIHFSSGLFMGLVGIGPIVSMTAAVGYELFEQVAERQPWGQKIFKTSGAETMPNIVGDLVLFAIGWWLADAYHKRGPKPIENPARAPLRLPPPRRRMA